jgi:hypothetical protein
LAGRGTMAPYTGPRGWVKAVDDADPNRIEFNILDTV